MSLLDELLADAAERVYRSRATTPEDVLRERAAACTRNASLRDALAGPPAPRCIAEIKRASPSAGELAAGLDAAACARAYAEAGAAAISVLTEPERFRGSVDDLAAVSAAVDVPVLRKDFIVDSYQLWEARAAGADAVLLIARALTATVMVQLMNECTQAGLEPLVEVHTADELAIALGCGARLVGINARDLETFEVDPSVCERLIAQVPPEVTAVAESGIAGAADLERLAQAGYRAFLVGTSLVTAADPGAALRALRGEA